MSGVAECCRKQESAPHQDGGVLQDGGRTCARQVLGWKATVLNCVHVSSRRRSRHNRRLLTVHRDVTEFVRAWNGEERRHQSAGRQRAVLEDLTSVLEALEWRAHLRIQRVLLRAESPQISTTPDVLEEATVDVELTLPSYSGSSLTSGN